MKEKEKLSIAEGILLAIVIIQLGYLIFFNLTRIDDAVNFDTVEYLTQVMQIWKQKTLLIHDYYYSTMLTWDMSTLLAVPFYGITGDVFLAWGIANNVLILLFVFVLLKICKDLEYSRFVTLFIMLCVFANYQWGYIDYIEELFINGALYGYRILFMLIFMDVLICIHKGLKSAINIVLVIIGLIGMFLCGASTGIFAIGCCVAPLFVAELWYKLIQDEPIHARSFLDKSVILLGGAIGVSLLGVATNKWLGLSEAISMQKNIISPFKMGTNFQNAIIGIFELFGWPNFATPPITSASGILAIIAAGFALCFIALLGTQVYLVCRKRKDIQNIQYICLLYITFILIVNMLLYTFVDLSYSPANFEYRYWVIVFIPAFVGTGVVFEWLKDKVYTNVRKVFLILFIMVLSFVSFCKDYSRYRFSDANDTLRSVMDYVAQYDLDEVFIYSDWTWSREMLAFQKGNAEYFAVYNYGTDNDGTTQFDNRLTMSKWGNFAKYDGDCLELPKDKSVGIIINEFAGEDRRFLASRAEQIIPIGDTGFDLYLMNQNYMDFVWGIPEKNQQESVDYFNWGYTNTNVYLNEQGEYVSNGTQGTVLKGTFCSDQQGVFEAKLKYNLVSASEDTVGVLRVDVTHLDGTVSNYESDITKTNTESVISGITLEEGESYSVEVTLSDETIVIFNEMRYIRQ